MYYKLVIDETGRNAPGAESNGIFNQDITTFKTIDEVKEYLIDRYGKMPGGQNKVYRDIDGASVVVGFLHSFWNSDCSHNGKKWYQTDWIELTNVVGTPVLLTGKGAAL